MFYWCRQLASTVATPHMFVCSESERNKPYIGDLESLDSLKAGTSKPQHTSAPTGLHCFAELSKKQCCQGHLSTPSRTHPSAAHLLITAACSSIPVSPLKGLLHYYCL
jgi:hypothetical protein